MPIARRKLAIVIPATLVLVALLLAVGYHFGLASVFGARSVTASSLTDLAPADANFVLYADLAALRTSPLLQPLQSIASNTQQDASYTTFVRATGFDYERDLDRLVLFWRKPTNSGPNEVIAVGEGRFDREKIRNYALANGTLTRSGSKEVYLIKSDTPGKTVALAFLGENRIAISDSGNLDALLLPATSREAGGDSSAAQDFSTRVERVSGAPLFAVWRASSLPQNFAPGGIQSQQLTDLVRSLRWVNVAMQPMTDRLRLTFEGECDTPDQAATLEGALSTLRLFADGMLTSQGTKNQMNPQTLTLLHQLLDSAAISHNDRWVNFSLDLSQELLQYAAQHVKQAPAPPSPGGAPPPPPAAPPSPR